MIKYGKIRVITKDKAEVAMILKLPIETHKFLIKYVLGQWGEDDVEFLDMDVFIPLRQTMVPIIGTISKMQAWVRTSPFETTKFAIQFTLPNNDSIDLSYDIINFSEDIHKLEIVDYSGHCKEIKIP